MQRPKSKKLSLHFLDVHVMRIANLSIKVTLKERAIELTGFEKEVYGCRTDTSSINTFQTISSTYRQQLCCRILHPHASPLPSTSLLSSSKSSFSRRPRAAAEKGKAGGGAMSAAASDEHASAMYRQPNGALPLHHSSKWTSRDRMHLWHTVL